MSQTKLQRRKETERESAFHRRVTIAIVSGFALLFVTAVILAMTLG